MIQVIGVEHAVGYPLAHDIAEIVPGELKRVAFQKGYVLRSCDVDHLRRLGKDHLYVLKPENDEVHEDDAAEALADALCGPGVGWRGEPREGKLSLRSTLDGLLKVDVGVLQDFNLLGYVMCATRHTNTVVREGDVVAVTRAIPLLIARERIDEAVAKARSAIEAVLRVVAIKRARVGVLITGSEVYYGRIEDKFAPIIRGKVEAFGGQVIEVVFLPDDDRMIATAARRMVAQGADVVITTGGMSVDPDDRTRFALQQAGAEEIVYGSAVHPGAMSMIAYLREVPVIGIPTCGMYGQATIFDLIYPRVLAGEKITREDFATFGHGGLCLKCTTCTFPHCPFGK